MKPIEFNGFNIVYGADQPEYQPLPAHKNENGNVLTCWELTPEERIEIFNTGILYIRQMTFNEPLQLICPIIEVK